MKRLELTGHRKMKLLEIVSQSKVCLDFLALCIFLQALLANDELGAQEMHHYLKRMITSYSSR